MGWLMGPIYTAISWILLRWHDVFAAILPDGTFLGTNWDWVLAIMFLVITVRVILFPIFKKQIRSQRAMQALQPKVKELQAKHKGDQQTLREEMMKLYQTEKVNPLMGCLPMFLQIPVFLGLFHVLRSLNPADPRTRTLYGWRPDQWDDAVVARLFGAPLPAHFSSTATELTTLSASGMTVKIVAGILVLIMMATTFMTSRQMILKTGWSQDPQQRMIQKLMLYGIPFSLLLSGWYFPIGVIIYWVTQNAFSFGQQYYVLRKYPPPVTEGNIPMKAAKAGAAAQPTGVKALLARFTRVLEAKPSATGAAAANGRSGGFLNPVQPAKSGLFRRKVEVPPPPPVAPQSRAPRPGAKPVHPKQASGPKAPLDAPVDAPADAVSDSVTDSVSDTVASSSNGAGPAAANNGSANGSANGSGRGAGTAKGSVNGSANGGAKEAPAKATPSKATPSKATPAKAAAGKSASPAKSATPAKKAAPRKGPASKKGGPRR